MHRSILGDFKNAMTDDWIEQIKARGLANAVTFALDALEPLGPLGAQMIWITQPLFGVFGGERTRHAVGDIAEALESADGIAHIRQRLSATDGDGSST